MFDNLTNLAVKFYNRVAFYSVHLSTFELRRYKEIFYGNSAKFFTTGSEFRDEFRRPDCRKYFGQDINLKIKVSDCHEVDRQRSRIRSCRGL